jgi:DNA-binding winged helix-turn-helix (wHTH) protein
MTKRRFFHSITLFVFISLFGIISCQDDADIHDTGLIKIALREAGNQLLIRQQDSTSIILPVVQHDNNQYQLSFQGALSFEPSELVSVIDSSFTMAGLSNNYRVEVMQCADTEVAYSYEMNVAEERTIIPCTGRYLTKGCYTVNVQFLDAISGPYKSKHYVYVLLFGFIVYLIFLYRKKFKNSKQSPIVDSNYSEIGSYQFYPEQNKLVKAATEINLSKKECELLELFVAQPNQIIKRDELTKKVWEDNGVFVGRSLDTYISKLRKKLKDDDSVRLINVHGVGYKLEVDL